MALFELICSEAICLFSSWYIREFVLTLTFGGTLTKKTRNKLCDRPLLDQLFMFRFPFENRERLKEKRFYVGLNLLSCFTVMFELVLFVVRQYYAINSLLLMGIPVGVLLMTMVSGPFFVPEKFVYKGVENEQAAGVVLLLGIVVYTLVYIF